MSEIQSVNKAFAILEYLSFRHEPCRLSDISNALQMPSCTIIRFLHTLMKSGYVSQDLTTGKYFITLKVCNISEQLIHNINIEDIAVPYIRALFAQCKKTICFAVESGRKIVYKEILYAPHADHIRKYRRVEQIVPYYATDVGKLFLINKTRKQMNSLFKKHGFVEYTNNTIRNFSELQDELTFIRRNHYSADHSEYTSGIYSYAVPIYNYTTHVVAALSICTESLMDDSEFCNEYLPLLKNTAKQISRCLGFHFSD